MQPSWLLVKTKGVARLKLPSSKRPCDRPYPPNVHENIPTLGGLPHMRCVCVYVCFRPPPKA